MAKITTRARQSLQVELSKEEQKNLTRARKEAAKALTQFEKIFGKKWKPEEGWNAESIVWEMKTDVAIELSLDVREAINYGELSLSVSITNEFYEAGIEDFEFEASTAAEIVKRVKRFLKDAQRQTAITLAAAQRACDAFEALSAAAEGEFHW